MHIGLWSTNQLLKDDVQYKYNIVAASIARAIGTILWVLLLVIPLVQVRVYMCIIKGLGRYATGINYIILSSIIYIFTSWVCPAGIAQSRYKLHIISLVGGCMVNCTKECEHLMGSRRHDVHSEEYIAAHFTYMILCTCGFIMSKMVPILLCIVFAACAYQAT